MKEIKSFVFFDIDGTLLPETELTIPLSTRKAISQMKANGHIPFICTGRCFKQAEKYINEIEADSFIVSNGQEVNLLGETIYNHNINLDDRPKLAKILTDIQVVWGYETRDRIYLADIPEAKTVQKNIAGYGIQDIQISSDKMDEGVKQFWIFGEKSQLDKAVQSLPHDYKCFRWSNESMEILPKSESKGKAVNILKEYAKQNNIKTYAFGDGHNDLELLEVVDCGVAMGNAIDELKEIADYVTADCTDDGIKKGLEHLKLI